MSTNTEVRPGDLITTSLWNSLLARLLELETQVQQLSGSVVTGTVTVPDVFGRTLKQAKAAITKPPQQLEVGFVIDAFGNDVDDGLQASEGLIVIGQMPAAGTKTNPASSVNLAVSATPDAAVEPPKKPKINPNGFSPSPVPAGTELTIGGENFAPVASDNKVTMDGIATPVNSGTPTFLKVTVPKNLPDGPNKVGDPPNTSVQVKVSILNKGEDTSDCRVSAPLSDEVSPHIDTITPNPGKFTVDLVINGTGFSANPQDHRVTFSNKPVGGVIPKAATPTALTVTLPPSLKDEFTTLPSTISFDVVVRTKEVNSNTKAHNILRVT